MRRVTIGFLAVWGCLCGVAGGGITPFIVDDSSVGQSSPDVSGTFVVWQQYDNGISVIRGKDLTTGKELFIDGHDGGGPVTNGSIVVWGDGRDGICHLFAQDIESGRQWRVGTTVSWQGSPAVGDNVVVWSTSGGAYALDMRTGQEFRVHAAAGPPYFAYPDVSGNIIVGDSGVSNASVYGLDVTDRREFLIALGGGGLGNIRPAISGNIVVWKDYSKPNGGIWGCDLDSNTQFPIDVGEYGHAWPDVDGRYVVWQDGRNGGSNSDIWGYDLVTGESFPIYEGPGSQLRPRISGNLVVWEDRLLDGTQRVTGAYIPEPASVALLGLGGALLAVRPRRRPRAKNRRLRPPSRP